MVSSPGFGSFPPYLILTIKSEDALFRLDFSTPPLRNSLSFAWWKNSQAHSSIGTRSSEHLRVGLSLIVSTWFQVLFHGAFRPSFHLSLAVLVHYRSCLVFSLGVWSPQIQKRVCRLSTYLGILYGCTKFLCTRLSRSLVSYSMEFY